VSKVDWLLSYALLPLSLILVGPVAGTLGVRATFVVGGIVGGTGMLAVLLIPSMRQPLSAMRGLTV
jgi:hypothetical protein